VSFQNGQQLISRFLLNGNVLSFQLEGYDPKLPLTIDPNRIWATYYGGTASTLGTNNSQCATDKAGNVYLAGFTRSSTGIATSGSHQITLGGTVDAFLVKFNSSGVRQWATYYGGSSDDIAEHCLADANGNIYLTGYTNSATGIATTGAYQTSRGGNYDVFLTKFNSSGIRQWGTYYGGSANDYGYGLAADANGNIYVTGSTGSTTGIATTGSHQSTNNGNQDAYLVKFNTSGVRQWATYYGGGSIEEGASCATDANGNIYVTGRTGSTTGIATTGSHQATKGSTNSYDGFLVKFNSSGVRQWASYYGGSSEDICNSCAVDVNGSVYITGYTSSSSGIAASGSHQTVLSGTLDAFLAKFSSSGVRQWATYYGGSNTDYVESCATDGNGNIYIAGITQSSSGIATSGSHQTKLNSAEDAFLVKFNNTGVRQWSTYYGGDDSERSMSCAADTLGNIYLSGSTESSSSIAYNGHQMNRFDTVDAFLVKFASTICTVDTNINFTTCINSTIGSPLTHTSQGATGIGSPVNLPPGLNASFVSNRILISGTPSAAGIYNYRIPLIGVTCSNIEAKGRITVNANSLALFSPLGTDSQIVKVNTAIANIIYTTTRATGIGTPVSLPPGVTATYVSNVLIISGTPTTVGTYRYTIPLTGGCNNGFASGVINVTSPTSVQYLNKAYQGWFITPNPTNGSFSIQRPGRGIFELVDIKGKRICMFSSPNEKMIVSELQLPAGVYLIREHLNGTTQKLVVQ
jgi:hypothetical protein